MTEVVVHRCTLRVVRRGGWSWGADPRRLLRGVLEAVPALVAARLAELLAEAAEGEISEPVRIRVPVRLAELLTAGAVAGGRPDGGALVERLDRALAAEVVPRLRQATAVPADPPAPAEGRVSPVQLASPAPVLLLGRLLPWRAADALDALVSRMPAAAVDGWLAALAAEPGAPGGPIDEREIEGLLARRKAELAASPARLSPAARRLLLIAEAAAKLAVPAGDPALKAVLDRLAPRPAAGPEDPPAPETAPAAPRPAPPEVRERPAPAAGERAAPASPVPAVDLAPRLEGEVRVASTLPWLLLGPLSRIGTLETLAAVLELAGLATSAPCFAAALAHKVLEPPGRGWHRSPAARAAAAAFAGLEDPAWRGPVSEPVIGRFAAAVADFVCLLDADLARATLAGRPAGSPLVLWRLPADAGLLLLDPQGLFPVAWEETVEGLGPVLALADRSPLLVPAAAADPAVLAGLDAAGARFLTPAPPTRVEPWVRQPGPGRWWTNRPRPATPELRREMARIDELSGQAEELAGELGHRPAVVHDAGSALERSVTLAAAAALGTLAWTLWREREPTDPQLALQRFADLDGVVCFGGERIRVRLPLGKRHRDLYEHGLLADVAGVPWLGGRVVEFSGG